MMNESEQRKFEQLRQKVFQGIKDALFLDNYCKSYEGLMSIEIEYPDYFEETEGLLSKAYTLNLHCYVLGPGRHYTWRACSMDEVIKKAEHDIDEWLEEVATRYDEMDLK